MSRYERWLQAEHGEPARLGVMLLAAPVFLGLLPFVVAGIGPRLDRRLGLSPVGPERLGPAAGTALATVGFSLGVWSVYEQVARGRGTPLPMMPTRHLLTGGPFRYCRNPMTLGAILAYLGLALAARTTAGTGLVLAFARPRCSPT